jgi:putative DNA primase/helicase
MSNHPTHSTLELTASGQSYPGNEAPVVGVYSDSIPGELKALPRFVVWQLEECDGRPRPKKVPYTPRTGRKASPTDPSAWGTFEEALEALDAQERYDGLGLALTEEDPFTGVDLDGCVDPETGEAEPWASEIVDVLDSYTELSPSGTGLHVIVRGELPPGRRHEGDVEMYDRDRYLTLTGHVRGGHDKISPEDRTETLRLLHGRYLGREEHRPVVAVPRPASRVLTDDQVLERCRRGRGAEKFARLYDLGNLSDYDDDWSRGDQALVALLARYTQDPDQIDRLFRGSALSREKWTSRADYRQRTIARALQDVAAATSWAPAEVQEALDLIEAEISRRHWPGVKSATRWKILIALIHRARRHGEMIPRGVRVEVAHRQLGELAGCATSTVTKHLLEMRQEGLIGYDNFGRPRNQSGAIVLPFASTSVLPGGGDDSTPAHLSTQVGTPQHHCVVGVPRLGPLPALRPSVAGLPRLGPSAQRVLDALLRFGGTAHKRALANALETRTSNLTRKGGALRRLVEAEIVGWEGNFVWALPAWREALEAARKRGAEDEAVEVQRALHALERAQRSHGLDPDNDSVWKALGSAQAAHSAARGAYRDAKDAARQARSKCEEAG